MMNPYEKYYLRKKIVAAAIAVGAAATVAGGVLIWQPWNRTSNPDDTQIQPGMQDQSQEQTPPVEEKEPDLEITVGGKKVACLLYRGDGFTIPYPMDWTVEEADGMVHFIPPNSSRDGSHVTVAVTDTAAYEGAFIAVGAKEFGGETGGMERYFYYGSGRGYSVSGKMTEAERETYEKTMTAMARTMTVGSERPFASLYPMASEPEWQVVDDEVILFLDKDGVDIESVADNAIKKRMSGWSDEVKVNFTGNYRLGTPRWDSSYTCVSEDYVDVFCVQVSYKIAAGKEDAIELADGQRIENGWLIDENALLYIAVFHDGSIVTSRATGWGNDDYFGEVFVAEVLK